MMAMVRAVSEVCGDAGRWVHYGATSNDILDTATALQLQQALRLIDKKLRLFLEVLIKRSEETKSMVCIRPDPRAARGADHVRSAVCHLGK